MQNVSLSSRRAWIEIVKLQSLDAHVPQSLSSRRAWIEIVGRPPGLQSDCVALLTESVD